MEISVSREETEALARPRGARSPRSRAPEPHQHPLHPCAKRQPATRSPPAVPAVWAPCPKAVLRHHGFRAHGSSTRHLGAQDDAAGSLHQGCALAETARPLARPRGHFDIWRRTFLRAARARRGRCRRCDAATPAAKHARGRGADALPCPHPPRPARASFRFVLPLGLLALQARGRLRCAHALAAPAHAWRARAAGRPAHARPAWRARLWALRSPRWCLRLARRRWRYRVRPDARVAPPCRAPQEDTLLRQLIAKHGARNWSVIANGIRGRSGKSCRLRWCNQLNPSVKKEPFSEEEDAKIVQARAARAHKWGLPCPRSPLTPPLRPPGAQGARQQVGNHRALAAGQVCHPPGDPRQTTTTDAWHLRPTEPTTPSRTTGARARTASCRVALLADAQHPACRNSTLKRKCQQMELAQQRCVPATQTPNSLPHL